MLQFTWHEDKHAANIKNHKVSFLRAALIFENEIVEMIDDREDYGELRYVALGHVQTTVSFTPDRTTGPFTSSVHGRPISMTKKPTSARYTLAEVKQQIAQGKDKTRADAPEGPMEDSSFWKRARVVVPPGKTSVHLRVDSDVLEWFKKQGDGHLTRMNAVLRSYVDGHRR